MNALMSVVDWQFLNEPLWRWFIFIMAFALMLFAWNGILSFF